MSLRAEPIGPIPEQTVQVAHAAFPKGNIYLRIRDVFGSIYQDASFASLFAPQGRPAESPWRLALVTVMQFKEGLSDRQAAEAVRGRIDWKYALGLELTDSGFDFSVLSEFRARLIEGSAEASLLDALLEGCRARGYLRLRGRQRTDSTHVLGVLRRLSRLELLAETLRAALNALAKAAPEWLRAHADPLWFERYSRRIEDYRLPQGQEAREAFAKTVGQDGMRLLGDLDRSDVPPSLRQLGEVLVLREVWSQQFVNSVSSVPKQADSSGPPREEGSVGQGAVEQRPETERADAEPSVEEGGAVSEGDVRLREPREQPGVDERLCSPYETEARYSQKRNLEWEGYKCHFTESCDEDRPRLVLQVNTTVAPIPDVEMLGPIQEGLSENGLLPREQLADAGYVGARQVLESRLRYRIELVGPTLSDHSWQAKAGEGFSQASFQVDFQAQVATCPMGKQSSQWCPIETSTGQPRVHVGFRKTDCDVCVVREKCTKAKNRPRGLTLHLEPERQALEAARTRESTEGFRTLYNLRSGIEGTFSQGVRALGLREARYRGLDKTHFQNVATACAIDLGRLDDWLSEVPRSKTRRSHFVALKNPN